MILLLVDDEKITIRGMLQGVCWAECGVTEVLTANSVEQAKKVISGHNVDIMLSDIEMPGENGIALMRWVRSNYRDIQCAFLTCHTEFIYAKEAVQLGCVDYLLKPLKYTDVEELIHKIVREIQQQRDDRQAIKYAEQWIKNKAEDLRLGWIIPSNGKEVIDEVEHYITTHLSEKLSIAMIADIVHLNPDYLNRLFRKYKGNTIGNYIITERMWLASRLLKDNKLSAHEISLMVGYESYSSFAAMFKNVYGVMPNEYKCRETEKDNE